MRIVMTGSGYVGLVSGACLADFGHEIICVDKDERKIAKLREGGVPIYEPGLADLIARNVKAGRLSFTTDLATSVADADVVFIAVGTPARRGDGHADLSYVYDAAREIAGKVRDKARGMFAGFKPKPSSPELARDGKGGPINTTPERAPAAPSQARAIERYARAQADMDRMREKGLPVLPHQKQALAKAGDALDQVRPHAARDLASAFERNPVLVREAAEGKAGGAARAMAHEAQVRTNPELRADRFVERWQGMARERAELTRSGDREAAQRTGKKMESLAGTLHRDPQLESVLQRRAPELGLEMGRDRPISQELTRSLEIGRDRGLSR